MKELVEAIKKQVINSKKPEFKDFVRIPAAGYYDKVQYIDGGNAELIEAPGFSVHFIRAYSAEYHNNKRHKGHKEEFFVFLYIEEDTVVCRMFPHRVVELEEFCNKRLCFERTDDPISTYGPKVRRLAELNLAIRLNSESTVLDGDLTVTNPQEGFVMNDLKKMNVVGLSKTSNVIRSGQSIPALLNLSAPYESWYYEDPCFVKLHPKSKHVFKLDMFEMDVKVIATLAKNATDPVFFGYPYGLIEADRFARVSMKEADYLKTKLIVESAGMWKEILPHICALDAHEILDSIS